MQTYQCIECSKAKKLLEDGAILLDIRDKNSYDSAHAKQAEHLSNDNLQQILSPLTKEQTILILCYHGISSKSAAQFISSQGFNQVFSVDGGFEKWNQLYSNDTQSTTSKNSI